MLSSKPPIGVTVITPSYRRVGRRAVQLFKKHTGLDVVVLEGKDEEGFGLKLKLDQLVRRGPIVFFDADWWVIRKTNFNNLIPSKGFYGVHDSAVFNPHAFPHTDCHENGLDKAKYINTGFFCCDTSDADTRAVFRRARASFKSKVKTADKTEQFHLNRALLLEPVSLLPTVFNFYLCAAQWGHLPFIPRDIIGLHAAGVPAKDKYKELVIQNAVFGRSFCHMHDDAILHFYANQYQKI